jgi:hypothetical protein
MLRTASHQEADSAAPALPCPPALPRFGRTPGTPRNSRFVTQAMSSGVRRATFCHCCSRVESSFSRWVAL